MDMLWGMLPEELKALMQSWGEPAFRGKQLFRDLQKGLDFEQMTVLSKPLRERLKAKILAREVHRARKIGPRIEKRAVHVEKHRVHLSSI